MTLFDDDDQAYVDRVFGEEYGPLIPDVHGDAHPLERGFVVVARLKSRVGSPFTIAPFYDGVIVNVVGLTASTVTLRTAFGDVGGASSFVARRSDVDFLVRWGIQPVELPFSWKDAVIPVLKHVGDAGALVLGSSDILSTVAWANRAGIPTRQLISYSDTVRHRLLRPSVPPYKRVVLDINGATMGSRVQEEAVTGGAAWVRIPALAAL